VRIKIAVISLFVCLNVYASSTETLRQEKIKKELTLTFVQPIKTNIQNDVLKFDGVTKDEAKKYKKAIKKLVNVSDIMKTLYQKQIGTDPKNGNRAKTKDDKELITRYGHPWCQADTDSLCVADTNLPKRTSGVIPDDVNCDVAAVTGSPFEVIKNDAGKLTLVAYATEWKTELSKAAKNLRNAATILNQIPREHQFANYLAMLANAFERPFPFPFVLADNAWIETLNSDSILFARIGPDEVGGGAVGDSCECKARYHFNLGLINKNANSIIERIKPAAVRFEKSFSELINQPLNYVTSDVQVQLPIFLDVILATGDDVGGPNGTSIGQTLPNWCGVDGKGDNCMHATMIYVNKITGAANRNIMDTYILPLIDKTAESSYKSERNVDTTVYHEMFHNFGPSYSKTRPNSSRTYGESLVTVAKDGQESVSWKLPIEELKAQHGGLYMATEFYKDAMDKHTKKQLTDAAFSDEVRLYKETVVSDVVWALRMILRAARNGNGFNSQNPYSRLSAVQIGFLTEQGALSFDAKAKTWSINFDKMPTAVATLMKKIGELYVGNNADAVQRFFLYYMQGDGQKLLHLDRIVEVGKNMPSVLFDYQIE